MIIKSLSDNHIHTFPKLVTALGNFDGVHFAHTLLIKKTCETSLRLSQKRGERIASAVFTFTDLKRPYITTTEEKLAIFESLGVEYVFLCDFDSVRSLSPDEFVMQVLSKRLSCVHALCGYNYRFGNGASGDPSLLFRLCRNVGIDCTVMDEISGVSSTRVRKMLLEGDLENANDILGRRYTISGKIVHGKGMGHTFGCPTVNIEMPDGKLIPKSGVYFTLCTIGDTVYPSITNIGVCPTFGGSIVSCENHLLDVRCDLYGEYASVEFLRFRRPEMRFSSPDELYKAVSCDISDARDFFLARNP